MRLFVGIPLPAEVLDAIETFSLNLRASDDGLRWSSRETWHITLQFLGETAAERYRCVIDQLASIRSPRVPVALHGAGIFDRAGVFWAGVSVSAKLQHLERLVVASTAKCGFPAEDRPYRPHVTLARAKGDDRVRGLRRLLTRVKQDVEFPLFEAGEFLLYESFLGSGSARHEVRERFPMGLDK